jgi:RNA polymerase sigma factor (sigma-70 family)
MSEDADLLAEWQRGSRDAGNALFDRHFLALYRFFRTKVSGELDDLVQVTFMKCSQAVDAISDGASFRGYLFAIARNVLRDHYRRESSRRDRLDFGSVSVADLCVTPTQLLADREEQRLLLSALRNLPLDDQIALELVYWEKLSGRELARVLGVPEGTARTRLRSARLSLEAKMAELARSPELLRSTLDNLEQWSAAVREYLDHEAAAP